MRHVSKSINSHSNKQIQGECLFPREEDSCRPVFTLPLPVLPSSSLQENSLGLDWRSFQTSVWCHRSALLAPWQPLSTPATAPGSIHLCAAYILPHRCRQLARVMGEFFSWCLVGILKRARNTNRNKALSSVFYIVTHYLAVWHFYLMTLLINCLFPIKIENWGQG